MGYVKSETEIGKNEKLDSLTSNCNEWSWKLLSLKIRAEVGKFAQFSNFTRSFQLRPVLSNFARLFPT